MKIRKIKKKIRKKTKNQKIKISKSKKIKRK